MHHPNNYGALRVADGIENLRDLVGMTDCYGDRMARFECVDLEDVERVVDRLLVQRLPLGMQVRNAQAGDVSGEALVEPFR